MPVWVCADRWSAWTRVRRRAVTDLDPHPIYTALEHELRAADPAALRDEKCTATDPPIDQDQPISS